VFGEDNFAQGNHSAVVGLRNTTNRAKCTSTGGADNVEDVFFNSVQGGQGNVANGARSAISGGHNRSTTDIDDWVAGGMLEDDTCTGCP